MSKIVRSVATFLLLLWGKVPTRYKLVIPLASAFIVSFIVHLSLGYDPFWENLSINLMATIIGSAIAIFGIEKIIKKEQESKQKPVKAVALKKVQRFITGVTQEVEYMSKASADSSWQRPKDFKDLYSADIAKQICWHLDVDVEAPVMPRRDWWAYLYGSFENLKQQADDLIIKYGNYLPETICAELEEITGGKLFQWIRALTDIKRFDLQRGSKPAGMAFGPGMEKHIARDFQHILKLIIDTQCLARDLKLSPFVFHSLAPEGMGPQPGASRIEDPQVRLVGP